MLEGEVWKDEPLRSLDWPGLSNDLPVERSPGEFSGESFLEAAVEAVRFGGWKDRVAGVDLDRDQGVVEQAAGLEAKPLTPGQRPVA